MKKGVWIYVLIFTLFIMINSIVIYFTMPKLTLNGGDIVLLLEDRYIEPGYNATIIGEDINSNVMVNSNVDTHKVGNYQIEYKLKYIIDIVRIRNVMVIETVHPELTINGSEETYVCPGKEYEEEGYVSIDNYDGDITNLVIVEKNENEITYISTDTSNNVTKKIRKLIFEDNKAPELTLKGNESIVIKVNTVYEEPGYTAIDNCLGDITNSVEVTGSIDTSKIGAYELSYKISDGYNETIKKRTIYVSSGVATLGVENAPGVIYLTFDDGPSENWTRIILDTLKKYNVKATFFLVPKIPSLHYLIKEEFNDGHSLGIHSLSHTYSVVYASDQSVINDVILTNETIKNITGNYTYLYRYPGGSSNTVSRNYSIGVVSRTSEMLHSMGYHYFDWNVSSGDAAGGNPSPDLIANNVISHLSKNRYNVVLMHDTHSYSAYALEKIIEYGIANGYTFAPITMNTKEVHHGIAN